MKKIIALLAMAALTLTTAIGCSSGDKEKDKKSTPTATTSK